MRLLVSLENYVHKLSFYLKYYLVVYLKKNVGFFFHLMIEVSARVVHFMEFVSSTVHLQALQVLRLCAGFPSVSLKFVKLFNTLKLITVNTKKPNGTNKPLK